MLTFPLTKKKFMALTPRGRSSWVRKWLSEVYQEVSSNRITPGGLDFFAREYLKVMGWSGSMSNKTLADIPEEHGVKSWLVFISNAIHFERAAWNISPKDQDLLPAAKGLINQKDRADDNKDRPRLDYHMALDGLRSLFNVGSIFRSCEAAGFSSIILGNTPGRENPTVQKTSMGTADLMPHTRSSDLARTLVEMKELGYTITAVETAVDSRPFYANAWQDRGVLVMGNEEYGISPHVMAICDATVHIPMFGRKNSINVANAATVLLFHIATLLYGSKNKNY
ncbi:MAG: TrmH family RNA methyltransferase [Desulfobacterium sp.]|jgi:tRNA G18 (ribose-2'-O)-methylase SpoU|nr:TrmH family RNA methyltransferase [Desulfobacterium sp.]